MRIDYQVYLVNLPGSVKGCVRVDETGFASIYINDQLSPQARRLAFRHEIHHLLHDDFYNDKPIRSVEREA